jgi:hypothetical protein
MTVSNYDNEQINVTYSIHWAIFFHGERARFRNALFVSNPSNGKFVKKKYFYDFINC